MCQDWPFYIWCKYIRAVGPNKELVGNKMFPDKAEMADFRNFWDDTHTSDKFNTDSPNILPFVGVWGVWEDITICLLYTSDAADE